MEQAQDDPVRMLVGLITTMATTNKVREELLRALVTLLCSNNNEGTNLWHALRGEEGVRLLISLILGVGGPGGPHQEYALDLLRLLSYENDESKRAVTEALVDLLLLNPIPDRPAAPSLALQLLTQLASDCPGNQIIMVESGALGPLTSYLSLSPPEEEAATDLLCLLFSNEQIRWSESALGAMSQLIAVLLEGGWGARCRAAKALSHLFVDGSVRNEKIAKQAVPPLAEILNTASDEEERHTALAALVRLLADYSFLNHADAEVETISVDVLCRILSSDCRMELKTDAAELCSLIFMKEDVSSTTAAACCVEPLVSLLFTEWGPCHLPAVNALDPLVDDEELAQVVVELGAVVPLVHHLKSKEEILPVAACRLLIKLGKQRPAFKEEILNAGAIKTIDEVFLAKPTCSFVENALSKLLRLLTNKKRGRQRYEPIEQAKPRAKGYYGKMMRFDEEDHGIRRPIGLLGRFPQ